MSPAASAAIGETVPIKADCSMPARSMLMVLSEIAGQLWGISLVALEAAKGCPAPSGGRLIRATHGRRGTGAKGTVPQDWRG